MIPMRMSPILWASQNNSGTCGLSSSLPRPSFLKKTPQAVCAKIIMAQLRHFTIPSWPGRRRELSICFWPKSKH